MFVSYILGWHNRKTDALLTIVFTVLASLVSTFLGFAWIVWFLFYPILLLSFPFVSTFEDSLSSLSTEYNINLCTLRIVSIPPENAYLYGFLFFFSVNLIGTILGYWINKRLLEGSFKRKMFDLFIESVFLSFIFCFFLYYVTLFLRPARLNHYLNDNTLWINIADNIILFCIFYFWVPALIATTIHGIYKWSRTCKRYSIR